jgi:hypothetical protein
MMPRAIVLVALVLKVALIGIIGIDLIAIVFIPIVFTSPTHLASAATRAIRCGFTCWRAGDPRSQASCPVTTSEETL